MAEKVGYSFVQLFTSLTPHNSKSFRVAFTMKGAQ